MAASVCCGRNGEPKSLAGLQFARGDEIVNFDPDTSLLFKHSMTANTGAGVETLGIVKPCLTQRHVVIRMKVLRGTSATIKPATRGLRGSGHNGLRHANEGEGDIRTVLTRSVLQQEIATWDTIIQMIELHRAQTPTTCKREILT